ncbi:MAG: GNAT family N-acetyltransferase [Methylococcales bacterium]|jgi:GNAT superfamily N-acetyltransferase|nr:GNAT family N-acetyltransferase [Methylococcales bacterium]
MVKKQIEKLKFSHVLNGFDCGVSDLNQFLIKYALQNQGSNSANTYVACENDRVIGFYTLVVGSVVHASAPKRITKGLARHPVPVMILARLAVDKTQHGQGIGRGLLKDVLLRTAQAADIAGIRALLVHAKDDVARQWYQQYDFDESPTDPLHLYLLLKDVKKLL